MVRRLMLLLVAVGSTASIALAMTPASSTGCMSRRS
jgi:hypothetical protein